MHATISRLESDVQRRYNRWRQTGLPPFMKQELHELRATEIIERFYRSLPFGADGVVGRVGVGTNRFNIYTVRRICQGLADEIMSRGFAAQQRGVVIAYDPRYHSKGFAEQASLVLANNNIKVYLFEKASPSCELAFAVRYLHSAAGISVSAGTCPADYNGLRLYGENGAPLAAGYIERISRFMEQSEDGLNVTAMNPEEAISSGKLVVIGSEIDDAYLEFLEQVPYSKESIQLMASSVRIVLTPLQGTAGAIAGSALERSGFTEVHTVPEQHLPDLHFSKVREPDPFRPDNLQLPYEIAGQVNADVVLAFNPEAASMSLSVKDRTGKYVLLSANQTAALLLSYMLEQKQRLRCLPADGIVLKSAMTSELVSSIAARHGIRTAEVTNGFQGVGARMANYERSGEHTFLFGFDEHGGFALNGFVRDRDAIQAAVLAAEMTASYKSRGSTVGNELHKLYQTYGWYAEDQASFIFGGSDWWQQAQIVLDRFSSEPPSFGSGQELRRVYDYRTGELRDSSRPRTSKIDSPEACALKYVLEDGSWYGLRIEPGHPVLDVFFGTRQKDGAAAKLQLSAIRSNVLYALESMI
ncbi:hypothetical protein BG53_01980 [Paenibacillus darwinianus]|uniref:Phosphoglucomutase n=1 Tax=Paenibacillus darwinianus TaxID=1380763 RepID=A0A9W5S1R5_9BACL|nr:phospho-sugar mutase [Paenibacillus darwinianus]EXX87540.1 hypothetical protein BG52_04005 [Paenibacillus darwinianus]EXX88425.1 hypothetical protein BG53_01980 [Paenibacillus darwinianus]EXX88756.1 hypothetical protein CH50_02805 [Paenibacillus darwinianus]